MDSAVILDKLDIPVAVQVRDLPIKPIEASCGVEPHLEAAADFESGICKSLTDGHFQLRVCSCIPL